MADKDSSAKAVKTVAEGYFKDNTVEIEIDGRKVRVFNQEAKMIQERLVAIAAKAKGKK
tara:strand:- start:12577 stop:12753 length:177 start_codon:yes stop_codon:yes gene_type:complete